MSAASGPGSPLAASRFDSGLLAEQGTFVVFSLATDILHNINPNIHVKEALRRFKPKKYLGLILSEVSITAPELGEVQHVRLVGVGACPPQADYARRAQVPGIPWIYYPDFLCLDPSSDIRDNERPLLNPVPSLPWKNCVLHTTHVTHCEVGQLHAHSDPWEVSPRDLRAVESTIEKDSERRKQLLEAIREGRVFLDQESTSTAVDSSRIISKTSSGYPQEIEDEISEQLGRHTTGFNLSLEQNLFRQFGKRADWRIIVNLSEDLSELSRAPYPGDFREECNQLSRLMDMAWERLPYDNILTKWPKIEDQQTDNWDNHRDRDECYPVRCAAPALSTSSHSTGPISHSTLPEAFLPVPDCPRFEELPDDFIPDHGVCISSDAPEIPPSSSPRHPEPSSAFHQGEGRDGGLDEVAVNRGVAVQGTRMASSKTMSQETSEDTSTAPTSSSCDALAPLPESGQTEKASHVAPATGQIVVDVKSEALSGEESPEKSRGRHGKLRTARRQATRKACTCFLKTSRAVGGRIKTFVQVAGRTGKRVLHEIVRCIIEPL